MSKTVFAIEGLDRLGKSSLIEHLLGRLGYFQVIHFGKPGMLSAYANAAPIEGVPQKSLQAFIYQQESFRNSMLLAKSGGRLIFDRWHIGEAVYSDMYRGYDGGYVFDLERKTGLVEANTTRLILLVEDFERSKHFVDDGLSLGPIEKRREEQERFIAAFNKSNIRDKRIICVTGDDGSFRNREAILEETIS